MMNKHFSYSAENLNPLNGWSPIGSSIFIFLNLIILMTLENFRFHSRKSSLQPSGQTRMFNLPLFVLPLKLIWSWVSWPLYCAQEFSLAWLVLASACTRPGSRQTWVLGPRTMCGVGEWALPASQVTLEVAQPEKGRPERVRGGLTLHNVTSHTPGSVKIRPYR